MPEATQSPPPELIERVPKVLLHEHLDGGLRPQTVLELAAAAGYDGLPEANAEAPPEGVSRGPAQGRDVR